MTAQVSTPSGPIALAIALWLTALPVWLAGCRSVPGCRSDPPAVAELLQHEGTVESSAGDGTWKSAQDGHRFPCDHSLRTAAGAWARIEIRGSGRARLEPETTVHFRCDEGQTRFDLEVGVASIQVEEGGAAFDLEFGRATLSDGEFQLRNDDGETRLEVLVGTATIERSDGTSAEVGPGQMFGLEIGRATIETTGEPDAGVPDAGIADASVLDAPVIDTDEVVIVLSGPGTRSRAPGAKRLEPMKPGEYRLAPGTELRLGRRAQAELARGEEQARLAGAANVVLGAPPAAGAGDEGASGELLTVQRGTATLEGQARARVPGGTVAVRSTGAGAEARIIVDRRRTRVRALRGKTDVTGKGGGEESLQLGERVTLSHAGRIELYGRAPARAHVVIKAGESPVIHDPRPPTAIGVDFDEECGETGGEGVVEVAPRRTFSGEIIISKNTGQANILLDPGRIHFYRVRCLRKGAPAEIVARGRLRVLRDRATKQLPRRPPRNTIDADGRLWTVLYQNALPEIIFVWPRPSGSGPLQLHISRAGGDETVTKVARPSHRMPSGKLAEGTYQFFFQRGTNRSKTSTLRIEFDNAAPSAFLRQPAVGKAWTGASLEVAGTALPGSSVSVAGTSVDADRKGRFSTSVSLPVASGIVAIRTAHSKAGIHYYLRRKP